MDGFPLYPRDRKDKKDRTGLVFSVILDTLIISQAPLLSQDVIYYALTLSFAKFPHKPKACGRYRKASAIADGCFMQVGLSSSDSILYLKVT